MDAAPFFRRARECRLPWRTPYRASWQIHKGFAGFDPCRSHAIKENTDREGRCFLLWGEIWESEPVRAGECRQIRRTPCRASWQIRKGFAGFDSCPFRSIKTKADHEDRLLFLWGEIWESNPRPSGPQPDALTNCANPTILKKWRALRDSNPRPTA